MSNHEDSIGLTVRPYMVTGGRTRAQVELALETLVRATGSGIANKTSLTSEAQAVIDLCPEALSIAEVSAHLNLPLQVVKVIVGDLVVAEDMEAFGANLTEQDRPDIALLERVLDGLQNL